jgi:hypothetical protein
MNPSPQLSAAQKMMIDIEIESLEFLKQVSAATNNEIVALTRIDLEQFIRHETSTKKRCLAKDGTVSFLEN